MEKGFTLAETLLTLGIIGVVAVITIPTVVSKFQEKVLKSQFKATYSILNQAFRLANYESGTDYYKCYSLQGTENGAHYFVYDECREFYNSFLNNLKQIEWERNTGVSVPYKTKTEVLAEGGDVTNSACSFGYIGPIERHVLSNGSILFLNNTQASMSQQHLYMTVDINGKKGPNKWGYDVFYLSPTKSANGSLRIDEAICAMWEKGGKRAANMLYDIDEVSKDWFSY